MHSARLEVCDHVDVVAVAAAFRRAARRRFPPARPRGVCRGAATRTPCSACAGEAAERDLLAGVDLLRDQERANLVGARDRAGDDGALHDVLDVSIMLFADDVGAGCPLRDVVRRDVDLDGALALADVTLVVRDVERRQQRRDERKRNGDGDVADAVGHSRRSLVVLVRVPDVTIQPRM